MKNPFSIEDNRPRIRIIPEVDKMPRAIHFASTYYGKCAVLLFNLILLWSFFLKLSWSVVALCGFLVLIPLLQKWKFILAFVWVGVFGLKDVEFSIWNFGELNRAHINNMITGLYAMAGEHLFAYRLFIIIGSGCLFFVTAMLIEKFKIRFS